MKILIYLGFKKQIYFLKAFPEKLKFIESNRYQGTPFYVKNNSLAGNVEITNEVIFADFKWEDINLRLLAFFPYWNIVDIFFRTNTKWIKNGI